MRTRIAPALLLSLSACAGPARPSAVAATPHFALHSPPLLNLHHFLYLCARAEARDAGETFPGRPVEVSERAAIAGLPGEERAAWDAAVGVYRRELAGRDLLFDGGMSDLKRALLELDAADDAGWSRTIDASLADALRSALAVYREHFWPAHDATNRAWIAAASARLARHEAELVARMTGAYGGAWPPAPVRVDVCAYANWAGAYTTGDPVHVTLASTDPNSQGAGALELLVHETSHCEEMIGPLRQELLLAFSERGAAPPRGLWHLFIFTTAGESVRRTLAAAGAEDYAHYGERTGLYRRGPWAVQHPVLAAHWAAFLDGELPRATALARIAEALAP